MNEREALLKKDILEKVEEYYNAVHAERPDYRPGGRIGYGGRVFDAEEMKELVASSLDFWLTAGLYAERFETELAEYLDVKYCSLVNSGSSANLLAFNALTSPLLSERRVRKGDEVITVACCFPTGKKASK